MENKQSFIAEARREQIVKAAIEVLKEIGYVQTSLSKIAQKAKISTGLISYHFTGKDDLMNHMLMYLVEQEWLYIRERVEGQSNATNRLTAFIEASLDYQNTHRTNNIALIEIVFNARTDEGTPYYLLDDDEEDLKTNLLYEILLQGQETKEFYNFQSQTITTIIQGAISESMLTFQNESRLDNFREDLTKSIFKIIENQ